MSGYRFCRTDDVALLVDAYERCRGPELAADPPLTLEAFKLAAREVGLWASSCMLAIEGDDAVGVLLGAKNAAGNLVHRIAIRADHQRRGHGRHLLESLRNKVAILGPPRLSAEIPGNLAGARRFFERCGFSIDGRYFDWVAADLRLPSSGLAAPITIDELAESGALAATESLSWEQTGEVLRRRSRDLEALAIASDVRIEAYVVHRRATASAGTEVVSLRFARPEALRALLGDLTARRPGTVTVQRSAYGAEDAAALASVGFVTERETIGYRAAL